MAAVSQLSNVEPFYYSGQGELFVGPVGGYDATLNPPVGFTILGNCPTFTITPNETRTEHFESMSGQRSLDRIIRTQLTASVAIQCEQWSPDNLRKILAATEVADAAGSVVDEAIGSPPLNVMIPLAHQGITNVVITDSDSAGPTTLPSSQYVVDKKSGCIMITDKTTGGPYDGHFFVSYDYQARIALPLFKDTADTNYMLRFNGLNTVEADVDGDLSVLLELYKVEFLLGQDIPLIGEGLSSLSLAATAKLDTDRAVDATLGRFGRLVMTVPVEEQA